MCANDSRVHKGSAGFYDGSETGRPLVSYFKSRAEVPKGVITDLAKICGRITARQKDAPFFFVEDDFLPRGTTPGVAGGNRWENAPSPWMPANSMACMT